jgi:PucR C-terminal helix-turn-helix domain
VQPDLSFRTPTGIALDPAVSAALRAGLPDVSARTVAAVTAEVVDYADPLRGEFGANITRAVELALATFVRLAEEPAGEDPGARLLPALEAAYGLGRGEARSGRTIDALLAAYRVGARVAWQEWGAAALAAGLPAPSLVTFAALVFAYIDQLSAASVRGHADELATTGRVREQYLERLTVALLTGAAAEEVERRAERAGWARPRTLTCLLGPSAHGRLERATLSIAADVLDPALPGELVVSLLPDVGPRRAALLRSGDVWVLGPERPWTEAAASYRRARRGLDRGIRDTEAHLAELVLTADPEALADLRAAVLAPLAGADRLADTLRSWLLHQGRRADVSRDLHVHPQTVRYRMTQIRALYGERLQDPDTVRDLVLALAAEPGRHRPAPRRSVQGLQADHAADDAGQQQHLGHRDGLGPGRHRVPDGQHGADPDPDRVRGADRQGPGRVREAEHAQHQRREEDGGRSGPAQPV